MFVSVWLFSGHFTDRPVSGFCGRKESDFEGVRHLLSDGNNPYQGDAKGRMVSVNGGSTWSATYNAFGRRVERISTGAGRTEDLFDPSGHLLGHLNGANGVWWEEYVHFDGRLLWYYTQATNTSRYFHVNALGSLGLATNQTGAPVEEMLYYPFGVRWQNTTGFGWDEKFAQFPQRDDDIQKYEASFREYAPGLGRWMSPDRLAGNIMNPQSLDRYTYALNNPVSNIDPLGLKTCPKSTSQASGDGCPYDLTSDVIHSDTWAPAYDYASLNHLLVSGELNGFVGAVSGSTAAGGGGDEVPGQPPSANNGCSTFNRVVQGMLGAANVVDAGVRAYALPELVGALAEAPPAAGVAGVYGITSIFGQAISGGAQLLGAIAGSNGGTLGEIHQTGDILGGPVAGLGTLMLGGSMETAQRNATIEGVWNGGVGLVDKATPLFQRGAEAVLSLAGVSGAGCHE